MIRRGNQQKKKETAPNPVEEALAQYMHKVSQAYGLPEEYVANKFNLEKFNEYQKKYQSEAIQKFGEGYKPEKDPNYLNEMIRYITSGEAFSDELKKAGDLEESLTTNYYDERTRMQKLKDFFLRRDSRTPKYKQFSDTPLYHLSQVFASDPNYGNIMPEIMEAVKTGVIANYKGNMVTMGYAEGKLPRDLAEAGKEASLKIVKGANENLKKGLVNLVLDLRQTAAKIAASVFGVLGILVLMMQMQFTGAVVGTNLSTSWGYYYGLGLILISLVIFVLLNKNIINKSKHKKKKIKHKPIKTKKSKVKKAKSKTIPKRKNKKPTPRKTKKIKRRK